MQLIAHRGGADRAPENTLRAVEQAAAHVDAVEVDVRRCGSGELVVVHDASLERLAGSEAVVAETPLTELREYRVLGSDQRIPRLVDVVDVLPDAVGLNVELKERGLVPDVEAAVAERDRSNTWLSSFDAAALAGTTLPCGFLFASPRDGGTETVPRLDWGAGLDAATQLDCDAVHPQYHFVVEDPDRVAAAHDAGFAVNVWTPPLEALPGLRAAGVDGVIVDDWVEQASESSV